ncbi:MAG: DUF1338 domain-containing protein [Alphaproteobacteria bacterium]|nr:DUF1338 domain-containing protein [Alphaproteobacteria bacterium]
MDVHAFFEALWADFVTVAPAAASIRQALVDAGETVVNDHVAFRTLDRGAIRLDALEQPLLALGYERLAPYAFPDKHLRAYGYVHPEPGVPKVFLSELLTDKLTARSRALLDGLAHQVDADLVRGPEVFWSGRPWSAPTHTTYQHLLDESEYAGWLAAMGLRANHFTVFVNALSPALRSVEAVLRFAEARGHEANDRGGRVKGAPGVLLEQGSTMADRLPVAFADGDFVVPTCFYEFALRHAQADGSLYPGFVAANADRIFESTNARDRAA